MWYAKATGGYSARSDEGQSNALEIASVFSSVGFSLKSIAAILGNGAGESGLNPWRWESDNVPTYQQYLNWTDQQAQSHGYGLFGFTPAKKYINGCYALTGYAPNFSDVQGNASDGQAQTMYMTTYISQSWSHGLHNYYADNFSNIGVNIDGFYNMTYDEFVGGNDSIENLTGAFELCFEKPSDTAAASSYSNRVQSANTWYQFLTDHPIPPMPTPITKRKMPVWMMLRPF